MSWGNPQVVLNELSQRLNGNGGERTTLNLFCKKEGLRGTLVPL
jgi:hypothetical protein